MNGNKIMVAGLSICRKSLVGWKSYLLNECMYLPNNLFTKWKYIIL